MVGTNDLARATKFYDATLESLNLIQVECLDIYTAYAPKDARDTTELYVTKAMLKLNSILEIPTKMAEALIETTKKLKSGFDWLLTKAMLMLKLILVSCTRMAKAYLKITSWLTCGTTLRLLMVRLVSGEMNLKV